MTNSPPAKEQTMTGHITDISAAPRVAPSAGARRGYVRSLLWLLLVISAVCNMVTSTSNLNVLIGIAFGLLTLSFGTALALHHYRYQRR